MGLTGCFPPYDASAMAADLTGISYGSVDIDGRTLHFAESGDRTKPMVLFVHGTPGSHAGWLDYLRDERLQNQAHLVTVDRPGFGRSVDGKWLPPLKEQAAFLAAMGRVNQSGQPMIVVGHSLGGTIAYRMGIDYPEQINTIIAIASSIDPVVGQARWYNHLANNFLVKWAVPGGLKKANREIMPLKRELGEMAPYLAAFKPRVTVIHGRNDALVGFGNIEYAERELPPDRTRIVADEEAGHFIIWEQPEIVVAEIERALGTNPEL